jgi:hypothetical protein
VGASSRKTYLVLAVAVTSRGATCHFRVLYQGIALLANVVERDKVVVVNFMDLKSLFASV